MSRARDLADGTFSGSFSADSPTLVVDDANNEVGIGTTNPQQKFHIENSANSSTWSYVTNGNNGTGAGAGILFGTDQGDAGALFQNSSGNTDKAINSLRLRNLLNAPIVFETNATERARIDSDGLKFNGDTAAANALDDYEEGEHTATVTPATSGSVSLYNSSNTLSYTKIGRMVHVNGWIQVYSVSSPVGAYVKVSLPFVPADLTDVAGRAGGAQCFSDASAGTITAKGAYTPEGEAAVYIYQDASTLATGDDFIIDINYNTS